MGQCIECGCSESFPVTYDSLHITHMKVILTLGFASYSELKQ